MAPPVHRKARSLVRFEVGDRFGACVIGVIKAALEECIRCGIVRHIARILRPRTVQLEIDQRKAVAARCHLEPEVRRSGGIHREFLPAHSRCEVEFIGFHAVQINRQRRRAASRTIDVTGNDPISLTS